MKSDPFAKSVKPVLEESRPDVMLPLSTAARATHASPTLAINARVKALRARGIPVIHFGFGESPFPIPDAVVRELRLHAAEKSYLPVRGLPSLRSAIARFHSSTGTPCSEEEVIVGPGSKMMLYALQTALQCPLILPSPSWVTYQPQAVLAGNPVHWIDTRPTGWRLDPTELEATCRRLSQPAMLLLNSPCNPTGVVFTTDEVQAIAHIARQYDLLVISDEIYAPLTFEGFAPSIAAHYPQGTVQTGGLSKWCGAGGWRLGYAVIRNAKLMETVSSIASETYSAVSGPVQYAAMVAFAYGEDIASYVERASHILETVHTVCNARLRAGGLQAVPATGGFYCMVDFTPFEARLRSQGIATSDALSSALLENAGVALLPGSAFGRPASELTARLAFVDFDGAVAMDNYTDQMDDHWTLNFTPNIAEGITRILDFLN